MSVVCGRYEEPFEEFFFATLIIENVCTLCGEEIFEPGDTLMYGTIENQNGTTNWNDNMEDCFYKEIRFEYDGSPEGYPIRVNFVSNSGTIEVSLTIADGDCGVVI